MTIEEIEGSLPNGFHDSRILSVRVDYTQRTAAIEMEILVSSVEETGPEQYRASTLLIFDLLYFVIEPPGSPDTLHAAPSLVAGGPTSPKQASSPLPESLPPGAFAYSFFVNDWNAFIHVAALGANIEIGAQAR